MGNLVHDVHILFEVSVKGTVHLDRIFRLLLVQKETSHVEILCPVVVQSVEHGSSCIPLVDQLR